MSACKLCQKEKIVSLTFCSSLCKEVYQWIEGKTKKRLREEDEEEFPEEGVNDEELNDLDIFSEEMGLKLFYSFPLDTLANMSVTNKGFNEYYKQEWFQELYIKNNYAKMDNMLLELLNVENTKAFFTWYKAFEVFENKLADPRADLIEVANRHRFQAALSKLFSDWINNHDPPKYEAFEFWVPKAINLGLWTASGANGNDVLEAVVAGIWAGGLKILLSPDNIRKRVSPTSDRLDFQFISLVAALDRNKGNEGYPEYKDRVDKVLDVMLESKLITLSIGGILTLGRLAGLGYSYLLHRALEHATDISVITDLGDEDNRVHIIEQAIKSRDEWTFIELINRLDWDFIHSVTSDMVTDCIRFNFPTAIKQLVQEIHDVVNLEINGEPYVTTAIRTGRPQIALYFLTLENFPELNKYNAQSFSDQVYKMIRYLSQPNQYEDRGQAYEDKQKLKADYWKLKHHFDRFK
jgi:hypothetical protein